MNCQVGHLAENCDEKRVAGNLWLEPCPGELGLRVKNLKILSLPDATYQEGRFLTRKLIRTP